MGLHSPSSVTTYTHTTGLVDGILLDQPSNFEEKLKGQKEKLKKSSTPSLAPGEEAPFPNPEVIITFQLFLYNF